MIGTCNRHFSDFDSSSTDEHLLKLDDTNLTAWQWLGVAATYETGVALKL